MIKHAIHTPSNRGNLLRRCGPSWLEGKGAPGCWNKNSSKVLILSDVGSMKCITGHSAHNSHEELWGMRDNEDTLSMYQYLISLTTHTVYSIISVKWSKWSHTPLHWLFSNLFLVCSLCTDWNNRPLKRQVPALCSFLFPLHLKTIKQIRSDCWVLVHGNSSRMLIYKVKVYFMLCDQFGK